MIASFSPIGRPSIEVSVTRVADSNIFSVEAEGKVLGQVEKIVTSFGVRWAHRVGSSSLAGNDRSCAGAVSTLCWKAL